MFCSLMDFRSSNNRTGRCVTRSKYYYTMADPGLLYSNIYILYLRYYLLRIGEDNIERCIYFSFELLVRLNSYIYID